MTRRIVGALALLPVLASACSDRPLTGPGAQAAFVRARTSGGTLGEGVIVLLDGREQVAGDSLRWLAPQAIRSIEIVKGPAARRLYGERARRGVIYISTDSTGQAK